MRGQGSVDCCSAPQLPGILPLQLPECAACWPTLLANPLAWPQVPFIGMYRKEECGELLCLLGPRDEPEYTKRERENRFWPAGSIQAEHRRIRRWDLLWAVEVRMQLGRGAATCEQAVWKEGCGLKGVHEGRWEGRDVG